MLLTEAFMIAEEDVENHLVSAALAKMQGQHSAARVALKLAYGAFRQANGDDGDKRGAFNKLAQGAYDAHGVEFDPQWHRHSTGSYITTVRNDEAGRQVIKDLRARARAKNKEVEWEDPRPEHWWMAGKQVKHTTDVAVFGRLGRNNPNRHLYARGGPLHSPSSQKIKAAHATRFDIYHSDRRRERPKPE